MKRIILIALVLSACSTPRYTYNFSHYREGNGTASAPEKKNAMTPQVQAEAAPVVATTRTEPVLVAPKEDVAEKMGTKEIASKPSHLTHEQKKEFRNELRKEVKEYHAAVKRGDVAKVKKTGALQAMDHNLKLAAIFGAVGIVLLIIPSVITWVLGSVALIVGIVFFIMWLATQ